MPRLKKDTELILPDDILTAEYDYIASTAHDANEDRSRIASFYFVSVGSIVAAILGAQFAKDNLRSVSIAFAILFFVLTILGALTIAQLARLRAAWHESIEAMNQIKDFYIRKFPETEMAFKWRVKTIPPTDKPYSIANLIALEVMLLGALTTAAAVYFVLFAIGDVTLFRWALIIASFAVGAFLQWFWYKHLLVDDR
jgi:MFS family permease